MSDGSDMGGGTAQDEYLELLSQGNKHLIAERIDEARTCLEAAAAIDGDDPKCLSLLGLVYFRQNDLEHAQVVYERLVKRFPDEAPLRVNLGLVYMKQDHTDNARWQLLKALELDPEHDRAQVYLQKLQTEAGAIPGGGGDSGPGAAMTPMTSDARTLEVEPPPIPPPVPEASTDAGDGVAFTAEPPGADELAGGAAFDDQLAGAEVSAEDAFEAEVAAESSPPPADPFAAPEPPPPSGLDLGDGPGFNAPAPDGFDAMINEAAFEEATSVVEVLPTAPPEEVEDLEATVAEEVVAPPTAPPEGVEDLEATVAEEVPPPPALGPATTGPSFDAGPPPEPSFDAAPPPAPTFDAAPPPAAAVATAEEEAAEAGTQIEPEEPLLSSFPTSEEVTPADSLTGFLSEDLLDLTGVPNRMAALSPHRLAFPILEDGFVRSVGLVAAAGQFHFESAHERVKGQDTEELFVDEDGLLLKVTGEGVLLCDSGDDREFTVLDFNDDAVYLRPEYLTAFESTLFWENGKLRGRGGTMILLTIRGTGRVALRVPPDMVRLQLSPGHRVAIAEAALVGWSGRVNPEILSRQAQAESEESDVQYPLVSCEGEGVILMAPSRLRELSVEGAEEEVEEEVETTTTDDIFGDLASEVEAEDAEEEVAFDPFD